MLVYRPIIYLFLCMYDSLHIWLCFIHKKSKIPPYSRSNFYPFGDDIMPLNMCIVEVFYAYTSKYKYILFPSFYTNDNILCTML